MAYDDSSVVTPESLRAAMDQVEEMERHDREARTARSRGCGDLHPLTSSPFLSADEQGLVAAAISAITAGVIIHPADSRDINRRLDELLERHRARRLPSGLHMPA